MKARRRPGRRSRREKAKQTEICGLPRARSQREPAQRQNLAPRALFVGGLEMCWLFLLNLVVEPGPTPENTDSERPNVARRCNDFK